MLRFLHRVRGHLARNTIAYLALFFALSGSAFAATSAVLHLGDPAGGDLTGTYPNPLIGDGKVYGVKIAEGGVGTREIAPGAVGEDEIADGAVTQAKLVAGVSAAIAGYELSASTRTVQSGFRVEVGLGCSAGKRVIGGGWSQEDHFQDDVAVQGDGPTPDNKWAVSLHNGSADDIPVTFYAICADAS